MEDAVLRQYFPCKKYSLKQIHFFYEFLLIKEKLLKL